MRTCNMCFQEKPLTEFYNSNTNKTGKQNNCKDCIKVYYKEWREKRKESPQSDFPKSKVCLRCHVEKPISQFGKRSDRKDKKMTVCSPCWLKLTNEAIARHNARKAKLNGSQTS